VTNIDIDTNGLRWFDTSPNAGDPDCTCSHCDQVIADEAPLRLWNAAGQEARLHQRCFALRTGAPPATEFVAMDDDEDVNEFGEADEAIDLGPCCACGRADRQARTLIALAYRAPQKGTGWGCVVCHLPSDGALAVVCDPCLAIDAPIVEVCDGYATGKKRLNRIFVTEPFDHKAIPH
jgi:hypothetical protein